MALVELGCGGLGVLYDLADIHAVDRDSRARGFHSIRSGSGLIFGLKDDCAPPLVGPLDLDPVASDEPGGLFDAGHNLTPEIVPRLVGIADRDADNDCMHGGGSSPIAHRRPYPRRRVVGNQNRATASRTALILLSHGNGKSTLLAALLPGGNASHADLVRSIHPDEEE